MRKIIQNVLLIGIVCGLGIIFSASTSRAATLKSTSPDNINNGGNWVTYFPNLTKIKAHNAYMWNMKHTKKIHNLNNYKNTDWYVVQTFTKTVNRKKSTYFKVTNYGKKITGLVYSGYLIKAKVTPITSFNNDSSYRKYLESS
ncbi:hypothetical protein [Secundilactobacillus folii]|uniref:Uncharacterized protein n=1 Tax=Secundilactobacillus folii TaxID=2678357 RepID=A0A7X2XX37_9LACO|nr:hypothetical protein [Secundilactobacillus folii]MTV83193.1 hypothetical protein [Secundilactobacillus folii]